MTHPTKRRAGGGKSEGPSTRDDLLRMCRDDLEALIGNWDDLGDKDRRFMADDALAMIREAGVPTLYGGGAISDRIAPSLGKRHACSRPAPLDVDAMSRVREVREKLVSVLATPTADQYSTATLRECLAPLDEIVAAAKGAPE